MTKIDGDPRQPGLFDGTETASPSPGVAARSATGLTAGDDAVQAHGHSDPARVEPPPDAADRAAAVDPRLNVVLEASAGTGKTSVLVARYLNLLAAGVEPANVLAITFTRKAAAEMRERIVAQLRREASLSAEGRRRWLRLRDRLSEITICTIDAFCLSLLREFPLEAGLDPSFDIADDTEVARLAEDAIDQAMLVGRALAREDAAVAFALGDLGPSALRRGLRTLLDRRAVALPALAGHLRRLDPTRTVAEAVRAACSALLEAIEAQPGGVAGWLAAGPAAPGFALLAADLQAISAGLPDDQPAWARAFDRLRGCFLTQAGAPRKRLAWPAKAYPSRAAYDHHGAVLQACGPRAQAEAIRLQQRTNGVLARGIHRLALVAERLYTAALLENDRLDFTEALTRAVGLLEQMDEFSRSRFRLESRYHHVLVDEFQDTSRLQWRLVSLLVEAWSQGQGLVGDPLPPTVFIVGDRKQSIYRFRDADVALFDEAARHISALRAGDRPRRSIRTSFRSVPPLLAFVNDLFGDVEQVPGRRDGFRYGEMDRFPVDGNQPWAAGTAPLGLLVGRATGEVAARVADEVVRLLSAGTTVRDRTAGLSRPVQPGDVAILFRSRESHRDYEAALESRGVPTYVYKGLGFFEADEIQDACVLVRYLADPCSPLHEAALLRSRVCRITDAALRALAPHLGSVLTGEVPAEVVGQLAPADRTALALARDGAERWLALVDRVPPADLIELILRETAYAFELRGPRVVQARENLKKFRGLVRRIQNRGYATLPRIADHLDRLSIGDESNAAVDAVNAVNLMTIHAVKGLEFPVVFVVNLGKGTGGPGSVVRVLADDGQGAPAVSIGSIRLEADQEEKLSDREETKRLLYVALTRARDRLYLAATLSADGELPVRPGSLAEIMPASFRTVIEEAGRLPASGGMVTWTSSGGTAHQVAVPGREDESRTRLPQPADDSRRIDLLTPIPAAAALPGSGVRALVQPVRRGPRGDGPSESDVDALTGRLVHRLFQAIGPGEARAWSREDLETRAEALLTDDDRETSVDVARVVASACAIWRRLADRDDVRALLTDAEVFYEVPFALLDERPSDGTRRVARGVIDCLVRRPDGEVVVLEIKSGRAAVWHARQLDYYVRAARELYPGAPVRGVIVRPGR